MVKSPEEGRPHHPPAVEEHLREMDPYRAFLVGQRDRDPAKGEGMARYLEAWERKWTEITGNKNKGRFSRYINGK